MLGRWWKEEWKEKVVWPEYKSPPHLILVEQSGARGGKGVTCIMASGTSSSLSRALQYAAFNLKVNCPEFFHRWEPSLFNFFQPLPP